MAAPIIIIPRQLVLEEGGGKVGSPLSNCRQSYEPGILLVVRPPPSSLDIYILTYPGKFLECRSTP